MQRDTVLALLILGSLALTFTGTVPPLIGLAVFAFAILAALVRPHATSTAYGSARLATLAEAARGGLCAKQGLILGRSDLLTRNEGRKLAKLLRLHVFTHLLTCMPTGRGKGVSVIVPNLLSYRGSVVVMDIKSGENYQLTAAYRRMRFGHRIFRLDPFEVCGPGGDSINPLDFIDDQADDFLDQCRALANALVIRQGTEQDPHWNDSAELVIGAFIAFVCGCCEQREHRNLQSVRQLISDSESFAKSVERMQQVESHHGVIGRLGGQCSMFRDKELSSVQTTIQRHLNWLDSPAVARATSDTTFDPRWLRDSKGVSFYLILPANKLASLAGLYRMVTGTLIHVLAQEQSEAKPVLFLLDEVAQMGRMKTLEEATTLMRGAGIRLWFFFQSLNQVKECYGDAAATLLDNIDTQQYACITSPETAEAISKRIGDCTVAVVSGGDSTTHSQTEALAFSPRQPGSTSRCISVNRSEVARRLMFASEIATLPEATALIFHRNLHVVPASLVRYFDAPEFADYRRFSPKFRNSLGYVVRESRKALRLSRSAAMVLLLTGVGLLFAVGYPPTHEVLIQAQREVTRGISSLNAAISGAASAPIRNKPSPVVKPAANRRRRST